MKNGPHIINNYAFPSIPTWKEMSLRPSFDRNVLEFCVFNARWLLCICLTNVDRERVLYALTLSPEWERTLD